MFSISIKEIYYLCSERQRHKKLASLILYTKHMLKSTYKITFLFTSNHIAKQSFRFYTFTLKRSSGKSCNIFFSWNLIACCIRFSWTYNDASLTLQRKEYHFFLKIYARITLRINKYMCWYDSQSVYPSIWT